MTAATVNEVHAHAPAGGGGGWRRPTRGGWLRAAWMTPLFGAFGLGLVAVFRWWGGWHPILATAPSVLVGLLVASPLGFLAGIEPASRAEAELLERLAAIGYDHVWLGTAADAYNEYWVALLESTDADSVSSLALPRNEHALLATWILAGLRTTGEDRELGAALAENVLQRALAEVPGHVRPRSV